ncbi:hypothetical protein CspeluHIS016_0203240 [Cutaneotrichosporon spelunceum]|uniref:ATP-dependent (S)-NAD(P)H-hydrate dehydratase n=1 Tax=Cutaneotrichosporon spelunceum TaxID=1672016 RepID=A0AAD3YAQ1_9TREE|nr:hypothetical protein CspeluHIS016_0203240 [Cutaneotrichosporon spelunceum]
MSAQIDQHEHLLSLVRRMIPPLSPNLHKGQAGRIGVLGGSGDYSGAPFFAAMGAMRFGADLAHVICEPAAGAVIKTYAPDLIVHTVLDSSLPNGLDVAHEELVSLMERLHVLVIGPGLGRSAFMQSCARLAIQLARERDIGVVVDADGLWLLNSEPDLVRDWPGAKRVVLTPNIMEFRRLSDAMGIAADSCAELARALGGVTVLQKGAVDCISDGAGGLGKGDTLTVAVQGGLKRVGGQGDILAGTTAALLAWGREWARGAYAHVGHAPSDEDAAVVDHVAVLAAYGASAFNRTVSHVGWERKKRAMVTHDLLDIVGEVYEDMFGQYEAEDNKGKL